MNSMQDCKLNVLDLGPVVLFASVSNLISGRPRSSPTSWVDALSIIDQGYVVHGEHKVGKNGDSILIRKCDF